MERGIPRVHNDHFDLPCKQFYRYGSSSVNIIGEIAACSRRWPEPFPEHINRFSITLFSQ